MPGTTVAHIYIYDVIRSLLRATGIDVISRDTEETKAEGRNQASAWHGGDSPPHLSDGL